MGDGAALVSRAVSAALFEHNEIQARLLDDELCKKVVFASSNEVTEVNAASAKFEVSGFDAVIRTNINGPGWTSVAVEIKPQLGDDYPAVIRQITAARRMRDLATYYVLLIESYHGVGASLDAVREICKRSGIALVLLGELQ